MTRAGSESKLPYPRGAFFILFGYLLERFVYYGLFGGAVFYMQRMLGFTSSTAKTVKAVMEGLIYLAPIAGAILADTYLGKARTVFLMCCGYTVGAAIYTLSSATPLMATIAAAQTTGISGLLVLGICAGLMKAVYSSLGADQFKVPEQRNEQQRFFYAFYWMINAGAFIGQFMTAQLRDSVQCFGDDCYLLPYIILVALMALSTTVFALGRSKYVEAPPDTMLLNAIKCVFYAIKKSWQADKKPEAHWIDRAHDRFDTQLLRDVKSTLRVLTLFCTFPLFWALFYQTSTGMIFQAKRLDGMVGSYRIPPEMSSTVNPLLILILIPLFDLVIYPLCDRFNVLTRTTSRMILGMAFAVVSFIFYALVNMQVEQTIVQPAFARIHVYNTLPCEIKVGLPDINEKIINVESLGRIAIPDFEISGSEAIVGINTRCPAPDMRRVRVGVEGAHETTLIITDEGPYVMEPTLDYIKDVDADAKVRIISPLGYQENVTLKYDTLEEPFSLQPYKSSTLSPFRRLSPQEYQVILAPGNAGSGKVKRDTELGKGNMEFGERSEQKIRFKRESERDIEAREGNMQKLGERSEQKNRFKRAGERETVVDKGNMEFGERSEQKIRFKRANEQDTEFGKGNMEEFGERSEQKNRFKRADEQDIMPGNAGSTPKTVSIREDGVYDIVLIRTDSEYMQALLFPMTPRSNVHMFWLLPQYLLITIGEVLFSVSGMDFAYSQAPTAMKSSIQAANLLTITVGLWLFAALTSISSATGSFQHRASNEAFLYAFLMALNTILFVILLKRFHMTDDTDMETTTDTIPTRPARKSQQQTAIDNPAFEDDKV